MSNKSLVEMICKAILLLCAVHCSLGSDHPAHLKPFGWGKAKQVEEVQGWPSVKDFMENYARKKLPVVMRGANKVWPGYTNWQTDDYFRKVAPEKPYVISMETKRGSPDQPTKYVEFKDFLNMYNNSRRRMVENTPEFLRDDVLVPGCLDCDAITKAVFLMGNKIWFGYNYTTSVVHKDAADNINCLVYGVKNYTMVDPKYDEYILMDRPDGLHSTMNVDKVDLDKFPGIENVEYQISELHGGDCIFVPYKWVHQVRSYGRNIAVNIWWNYWRNDEIDISTCPDKPRNISINDAQFNGWGDFETKDIALKEHFIDMISMTREDLEFRKMVFLFTIGLADMSDEAYNFVEKKVKKYLRKAFDAIDLNGNGKIEMKELKTAPEENYKIVIAAIRQVFARTRMNALKYAEEGRNEELEKKMDGVDTQPENEEDDEELDENWWKDEAENVKVEPTTVPSTKVDPTINAKEEF